MAEWIGNGGGRVVVSGDPCGECSPNKTRGWHWSGVWRLGQKWQTIARDAWRRNGCPTVNRATVQVVIYRGRTLDPDNAMAGCKAIVDGLKGVAFPDDSAAFVEYLPVKMVTGKLYARERARVEIYIKEAETRKEGAI